jgi:hypothetical protein
MTCDIEQSSCEQITVMRERRQSRPQEVNCQREAVNARARPGLPVRGSPITLFAFFHGERRHSVIDR